GKAKGGAWGGVRMGGGRGGKVGGGRQGARLPGRGTQPHRRVPLDHFCPATRRRISYVGVSNAHSQHHSRHPALLDSGTDVGRSWPGDVGKSASGGNANRFRTEEDPVGNPSWGGNAAASAATP